MVAVEFARTVCSVAPALFELMLELAREIRIRDP